MSERQSQIDKHSTKEFETKVIHSGFDPDPQTGAVNPPIYATSTYAQDGVGNLRGAGYEYSRTGNPTRDVLEANLAALEAGNYARAFASGMAATDATLRALLKPGDHIIIPNDAYGGTYRIVDKIYTKWGITYDVADITKIEDIAKQINPKTKAIFIETPTNPLLNIADIKAISELTQKNQIKLVVDNTFATPYLQQPLNLGADVVTHSLTKYLAGHSDVIGGAVITRDQTIDNDLGFIQNSTGATLSPFDSYLTIRGIKTLAVRMNQHGDNALKIAKHLEGNKAVDQVIYPGLESHPGHLLAKKQMRNFGGMISLLVSGGPEKARKICSKTEIFTLAESLGGVESLIEYPAAMTHASTAGSQLEVPENLIRISVGIENVADLIADLENALND